MLFGVKLFINICFCTKLLKGQTFSLTLSLLLSSFWRLDFIRNFNSQHLEVIHPCLENSKHIRRVFNWQEHEVKFVKWGRVSSSWLRMDTRKPRPSGHLPSLCDLAAPSVLLCSSLHCHLPHIRPVSSAAGVSPGQRRRRGVPDPARPSPQAGAETQNLTNWPATGESAVLACLNGSPIPRHLQPFISVRSVAAVHTFYYDFENTWKLYTRNWCYVSFCRVLQSDNYKFK